MDVDIEVVMIIIIIVTDHCLGLGLSRLTVGLALLRRRCPGV